MTKMKLGGGEGVCGPELGIRSAPDAFDAAAGAEEYCGRSERDKRDQKGVLDQILALLVFYEVRDKGFHVCSLSPKN